MQQILGNGVTIKVEALKEKLAALNLPRSGKKIDLMKRLIAWSLSQTNQEAQAPTAFNVGINNIKELLAKEDNDTDDDGNSDNDDSDAD